MPATSGECPALAVSLLFFPCSSSVLPVNCATLHPERTCVTAALATSPLCKYSLLTGLRLVQALAHRQAASPSRFGNSAHAHARGDPSALDQLSRRHSPGNVLQEFARGGVLASLPAMIAEAGEGDGAPGERPAAPGAAYHGPMGSGREVLLQVRKLVVCCCSYKCYRLCLLAAGLGGVGQRCIAGLQACFQNAFGEG